MKLLVLNHLRRWWWALAAGAAFEFLFGFMVVYKPSDDPFGVVPIALAFPVLMGPLLLSLDLQRGLARYVPCMPLTAGEIGRAWWLQAVGLPAAVVSGMLFLGAGIFHLLHPHAHFPAAALGLTSVFSVLWPGASFAAFTQTTRRTNPGWWESLRILFFGLLWGMSLGCTWLILQDVLKNFLQTGILLVITATATGFGWLSAGQFALGRVRPQRAVPGSRGLRGQYRAPGGYGGVRYLIGNSLIRGYFIGMMMVSIPLAMALLPLVLHDRWELLQRGIGEVKWELATMMMCLTGVLQIFVISTHLRFLRTLPISASKLAAVMIGTASLPVVAVGATVAGLVALTSGPGAALMLMKAFVIALVPAALCGQTQIWRSMGLMIATIALLAAVIFLVGRMLSVGFLLFPNVSLVSTFMLVGIGVAVAFLLTRRSLLLSSNAYRAISWTTET
jgi:hypothetical protein